MKERCGLRYPLFGLCLMILSASVALASGTAENAGSKTSVTRLVYEEIESGTDRYENHYLFTPRYLRIHDPQDGSGFILFDRNDSKIYSVSHDDRSILVIPRYPQQELKQEYRHDVSIDKLDDAPRIDNRPVYTYRVSASPSGGGEAQLCADIQLVLGLLPVVTDMLHLYMQVISSQQQMNLEKTPAELRTPCFLQDQIFNTGEYYRKGLPVREWHSNGKQRLLVDFGQLDVESSLFVLPPDYRRFSIEQHQVPQVPPL